METGKQQFWALSYRTSIELYGNNNWKIMDFTRRLVGSWRHFYFGTGPNGHRVGDHLFTEKVHRCAVRKKQNQGWMDGWSLVDFLDGVFFVCFLHDVPWFVFPLDTIRYGVGHCIRMFRFEGCEWSQIVGIGWTESDVGAIYVEDRCGFGYQIMLWSRHISQNWHI